MGSFCNQATHHAKTFIYTSTSREIFHSVNAIISSNLVTAYTKSCLATKQVVYDFEQFLSLCR